MDSEVRVKVRADAVLHKFVVAASLVCFIVNSCVLLISCVAGQWLFGAAFCQIYGMLSQVLVAGSAWMVALAALERGYKLLLPAEHVATFSEINVRILAYGMYLLLLVMYTAPLYGWGEYSNYRGAVHLNMNIYPGNTTSCIDNMTYGAVFQNASKVTSLILNTEYKCDVRFLVPSNTLILRFLSLTHLQLFHEEFTSGVFTQNIYNTFVDLFSTCNVTQSNIVFHFQLPRETYAVYKDVHLTFQELGVCSLDYSPVNANISSWIPFSILSTSVLPFGIAIVLGLLVYRSNCANGVRVQWSTHSLVIGSLAGLSSTIPFYTVNIYNNMELHVAHSLHVVATLLYFSSGLWYVMSSACLSILQRRSTAASLARKDSESSLKTNEFLRRRNTLSDKIPNISI